MPPLFRDIFKVVHCLDSAPRDRDRNSENDRSHKRGI